MLIAEIVIMLRTKCFLRVMSCNVQSMCQASKQSSSAKATVIKRLMKEYKSVFGELIETKGQKKKRLKMERKGKIPQEKSNTINTELQWISQNSLKNLKKIVVSSKAQMVEDKVAKNDKDTSLSKNSEAMPKVEEKISNPTYTSSAMTKDYKNNDNKCISTTETCSIDHNAPKENNNHNAHSSNLFNKENPDATDKVHSAFKRLPDIIIKNLPSFPIVSNKQESFTESTEVLSISQSEDPKTIKFPSVTKILAQTMSLESKLALEAWKERMIQKLGQDGFILHQKALLEDGTSLHSCVAQNLLGKEFELPPRIEPVFRSVQSVLGDIRHVKAIETYVAHTKLCYKGIVDCVGSYRGENYVIDWKKSDRKKLNLKETYDGPAQIAAYIGAINSSHLYPFVIKRGLLVIAYTCGSPATVHEICDNTLQHYWTEWLHRLQKYYVGTANEDDNENTRQ